MPPRCLILDSCTRRIMTILTILTMLLGQHTQSWTLFDPTSRHATLLVTSHSFPQSVPSFSITGTKMHSDLLVHAHTLTQRCWHKHAPPSSLLWSCLLSFSKWQRALRLFGNSPCLPSFTPSLPLLIPRFSFFKKKSKKSVMDKEFFRRRLGLSETLLSLQQVAQYFKIYFCPPLFKRAHTHKRRHSFYLLQNVCPILIPAP